MNTNRKCTLFLALLSALAINQTVVCAASAVEGGLWDLRDQGLESLIPLGTYNEHNYNNPVTAIKTKAVIEFLDNEMRKNGLDPELFSYFVGIDQDWQMVKLNNGYGLIIPASLPSDIDFVTSLFSSTRAEPAYELNIQGLNKALMKSDKDIIQEYRLALVKAIVAAKSKGQFNGLTRATAQATIAYLRELSKMIDPNLPYIFIAIANTYPLIVSNQQEIQAQTALDEYVLASLDIKLLNAHIEDLEKQNGSVKLTWSFAPSSLKASKSALEERTEMLKEFLMENDLELRLTASIKKNKKNAVH